MTSKGRSTTSKKALDRPFDPAIWRRAKRIAAAYRIVLEPAKNGLLGYSIEMPTVAIDGTTPNECFEETREALTVGVATMLELGRTPPGTGGRRTAQVNIRLSYDEKLRLEEAARDAGFRGLSDYVRHAALVEARKR
jgi:predicted RNase H-like HicB family nuclease